MLKIKDSVTVRQVTDNFLIQRGSFWYKVDKGFYLSFCSENLEYAGIEMQYLCDLEKMKKLEKKGLKTLKEKGFVEEVSNE